MMGHTSHWKALVAGKQGLKNTRNLEISRSWWTKSGFRPQWELDPSMGRWPAGHLSLAVMNATFWAPCVMQGVGPAVDQDIPLTGRKLLGRAIIEPSFKLCLLRAARQHTGASSMTPKRWTQSPLTARVSQYCGSVHQACLTCFVFF